MFILRIFILIAVALSGCAEQEPRQPARIVAAATPDSSLIPQDQRAPFIRWSRACNRPEIYAYCVGD
jgi:hypothetical protein